MAITFTEKHLSRNIQTDADGEAVSAEFVYTLRGVADESTARSLAASSTASEYGDLIRSSIALEPIHVDTANPDGCLWEVAVQYGKKEQPEEGESTFQFDTGGGTRHITQSLATVSRYAPTGKTASDFQGAIGVTHDSVEGVDITVPAYHFSETHYLPDSQVTLSYRAALFGLTGKVNDADFKGLSAGECLFLGAAGSQRGFGEDWEITFRFAASPNTSSLTVGPITGIAKKGWEYLWVRYADVEDPAAKAIVKQPVAAYVEKVYEDGDFSQLGIGA